MELRGPYEPGRWNYSIIVGPKESLGNGGDIGQEDILVADFGGCNIDLVIQEFLQEM